MPLHRSINDKILGGVCGGLAESLGVESIFIRLVFLVFTLYAGNGLLLYIILWMILPQVEVTGGEQIVHKLYRSRRDKMLGGVCSGLAEELNKDVSVIRLIFIGLSIFVGGGLLIYLLLWLLIPLEPAHEEWQV